MDGNVCQDTKIVFDKSVALDFRFDRWIVQISIQHNDAKSQHIRSIDIIEYEIIRIAFQEAACKFIHYPVNFLSLARQAKGGKKAAEGIVKLNIFKRLSFQKFLHNRDII